MNVLQRASGIVLIALLASACTDQSITDVSRQKVLGNLGPSFLVAGTAFHIQFEPLEAPPAYLVGKIHLQDDWLSSGPYDHFVVLNSYDYASFGDQSLRISNAITSGSFGDQTFSKRSLNYAGETTSDCATWCQGTLQGHFEAEWDFASTSPATEQPGLAISASPDRGDGSRMSFVRLRDTPTGLAVDFADVQGVDGIRPACGEANFVETTVATGLSRGVHTLKITMDLLEEPSNDIVKVYVDGSLRHTGTSWEDYFRFDCEATAHLGKPPIVNRVLYRTAGAPAPATVGNGFVIDNLSLGTSPNVAATKESCKNGDWESLLRADGTSFKNQGECVQYTNS